MTNKKKEGEEKSVGKRGMAKWFQRDNLIILVLSGVLLFIIALPAKKAETAEETGDFILDFEENKERETLAVASGMEPSGGISLENSKTGEEEDYAALLEQRLEDILSGISGVGKVQVMVTLQSSEELIVEKDTSEEVSDVSETDAAGGKRITTQNTGGESTVYSSQGSDSTPYVVMRRLPRVEGILVVAQGAGNGAVSKSLTEAIQALFDLDAHKIKVVRMKIPEK